MLVGAPSVVTPCRRRRRAASNRTRPPFVYCEAHHHTIHLQGFEEPGENLSVLSYSPMGSPGEEGGEDSFAASGSFLNLRLGDNGNSALPPLAPNMHSLAGSVDVDNDTHSALQTGMSTASMYGGALDTVTKTSDSLGSKVSMWDLRCDILSLLEGAKGAPTAEVSIDVLERMRHVMRDHIRSRKVQRGLAQQAKVSLVLHSFRIIQLFITSSDNTCQSETPNCQMYQYYLQLRTMIHSWTKPFSISTVIRYGRQHLGFGIAFGLCLDLQPFSELDNRSWTSLES